MFYIFVKLDNFLWKFDYLFSMGFKVGVIFWVIKIRELDFFSKSFKIVIVFEIKYLLNVVFKIKLNMYFFIKLCIIINVWGGIDVVWNFLECWF